MIYRPQDSVQLLTVKEFIEKDFHRIHLKYGTSKETYDKWRDNFYMRFPIKTGMPYEELKSEFFKREEEFKSQTLDYQI